MKKVISFLLIFIMIVLNAAPISADAAFTGYGPSPLTPSKIHYKDMEVTVYDGTRMRAILDDMREKRGNEANSEAIISDYDELVLEFDVFATQYALNNICYYSDVSDEKYAEAELEMSSLWTELADEVMIEVRETLNSPCGAALKAHIDDEETVQDYLDYEDMTEREHELSAIADALVQDYDKSEQKAYTITEDGQTWDEASVYEAFSNGDIEEDVYNALLIGIAKQRNDVEAGIYAKLVNAKNEYARSEGYDNYAEYAYYEIYNRDYSIDDAKRLYGYVKEYIVPAMEEILSEFYSAALFGYDKMMSGFAMDDEELVDLLEPYIAKVDVGLVEAYDYLKTYHTYDLDILDTKMEMGYTTSLYSYGCPFIFNCGNGSYYDVETLIHEFGHYNNSFHNDDHCISDPTNMDVAEIHSQGLEMLMLEYHKGIYGKKCANIVTLATLYSMLASVTEGCLYDEFQNEVYAYPGEITAEECNRIFRRLADEYGHEYLGDDDEAYDWVSVSHTFQSPMYYISYATSALAALDIFALSVKDRKKAVDLYMELTTYGLSTSFCTLLDEVGLPDIFEESTIVNITNSTADYAASIYSHSTFSKIVKGVLLFILFFVIGIVVLIVLLVKRSKKRKRLAAEAARELTYLQSGQQPSDPFNK